MSRPGYIDKRGNNKDRKRRKERLLATFDPELGPDQARCRLNLHPRCLGLLDIHTVTPDRIDPGGSYAFEGLQPACHPCQSRQGGLMTACTLADLMTNYYAAREQWEIEFQYATGFTYERGLIAKERRKERRGGRREVTDYLEEFPPPIFRDWLAMWHASRREPGAA